LDPSQRGTIELVGVVYSSPDSPFTRITVLYRCRCGAALSEVGRHAGDLPQGWKLEDDYCICAHCAELMRAGKLSSSTG
jgi:hypothetical protein